MASNRGSVSDFVLTSTEKRSDRASNSEVRHLNRFINVKSSVEMSAMAGASVAILFLKVFSKLIIETTQRLADHPPLRAQSQTFLPILPQKLINALKI